MQWSLIFLSMSFCHQIFYNSLPKSFRHISIILNGVSQFPNIPNMIPWHSQCLQRLSIGTYCPPWVPTGVHNKGTCPKPSNIKCVPSQHFLLTRNALHLHHHDTILDIFPDTWKTKKGNMRAEPSYLLGINAYMHAIAGRVCGTWMHHGYLDDFSFKMSCAWKLSRASIH